VLGGRGREVDAGENVAFAFGAAASCERDHKNNR
jgi:hypothetical protein